LGAGNDWVRVQGIVQVSWSHWTANQASLETYVSSGPRDASIAKKQTSPFSGNPTLMNVAIISSMIEHLDYRPCRLGTHCDAKRIL